MKGVCIVLAALVLAVSVSASIEDQEKNCKEALLKFQIPDALDCYSSLGDAKIREAQVQYSQKNYDRAFSYAKQAMDVKAGMGFCFNSHGCGGAATAAGIASGVRAAQGDEGGAKTYGKKCLGFAEYSGQCYDSDSKARALCSLMYCLSVIDGMGKIPETRQDEGKCKLIRGSGAVKNLDILYMGHGFTNLTEFTKYVEKSANSLLGYSPFSANAGKINIRVMEDLTNFDCVTLEPRMYQCNDAKIAEARAGACPSDNVVIIVKSNEWRGAGVLSGDKVTISSSAAMPASVIVHEIGHNFGLSDEYMYEPGENFDMSGSPNCDPAANCPLFTAKRVNTCLQGCSYNTYSRSVDNGLMRKLDMPFGAFDEDYIKTKLGAYG